MLVDAHAHLNEPSLSNFLGELNDSAPSIVTIISNSVDSKSSIQNVELAKRTKNIVAFVGIHPEIFRNPDFSSRDSNAIDLEIDAVRNLLPSSSGIGEIGIDPKYGSVDRQERLFSSMLAICEKTRLPVSIHSRNAVQKILEVMTSFELKGAVLFHWFAGTEQELTEIAGRGFFVSYGPAILTSKRMSRLVEKTSLDRILAETDSPTPYSFVNSSISTPFLIASTIFKIGLIRDLQFQEINQILNDNVFTYLGTQTSLRVRSK